MTSCGGQCRDIHGSHHFTIISVLLVKRCTHPFEWLLVSTDLNLCDTWFEFHAFDFPHLPCPTGFVWQIEKPNKALQKHIRLYFRMFLLSVTCKSRWHSSNNSGIKVLWFLKYEYWTWISLDVGAILNVFILDCRNAEPSFLHFEVNNVACSMGFSWLIHNGKYISGNVRGSLEGIFSCSILRLL